jgi:hypothetical protein
MVITGRIRIPRRAEDALRIQDQVLKSVGFIAEKVLLDGSGTDYDHWATAFFISLPSRVHPERWFPYLVTARHVAEGLDKKEIAFLVNGKGSSGVVELTMCSDHWTYHPTDPTADVAVLPMSLTEGNPDIVYVSTNDFLIPDLLEKTRIGVGDEVYFPGLFTYAPGSKLITPLLRHGNIAMLPAEQIQVASGFADAYLVEARSIGGLSGSPVFVRATYQLPAAHPALDAERLIATSSRLYFFGLMHGHWDIAEREMNKTHFTSVGSHGVNMGISVVVPAFKILEALNHPELVAVRDDLDAETTRAMSPTPDTGIK